MLIAIAGFMVSYLFYFGWTLTYHIEKGRVLNEYTKVVEWIGNGN